MTQNIYDDPVFFAGYSGLPRSIHGLAGTLEWATLRALLPELAGLRVLDLGCGFGWFCRFAAEQGAAEMRGVDVSENMLARARAETPHPAVSYERADLERFTFPARRFDLVYSSLAFHYIADAARLYAGIHETLVPGGSLVFSTEHPIYMAPSRAAWSTDATGRKTWPLDGYFREGPRSTRWFAEGVVKYHRTVGTTLNLLIRSGFSLTHVEEYRPTGAEIAARPILADEIERPMFLIVAARRQA